MCSKWFLWFLSLCVACNSCSAVIYSLNDAEYARMPPLFSLEPYDMCLYENGTYCIVQLHLTAAPGNQLMHTIQNYSAHTIKHYNYTVIDRGVCVTKSCQSHLRKSGTREDLTDVLEECLNESLQREFGLSARVSTLHYCERYNELIKIDVWDWTVLAVILIIFIINFIGSFYDYYEKKNEILLSFSIMRNWNRLTDTKMSDAKSQDLQFGHGIRMITSLCTMVLHVIFVYALGFTRNPHDIEKTYYQTSYQIFYSGLVFLQVFFFTSGFLKSYNLQSEKEKYGLSVREFPKTMMLRLSRLVPALAMTLAFCTSWLRHMGSGPLWKLYVTNSLVQDCRNYWWHHLLFINNYTQQGNFCLLPTWHLAADMQVFLSAVLMYLVSRRLLMVMMMISAAAPAVHTVLQHLDVVMITPEFFRGLDNRTFWIIHVLGHNNLPSFVLGVLTAERIYCWQQTGGHLVARWWWKVTQYTSVAAIPLLILSGRGFYADSERSGLVTRAVYNATVRVLFGLICASTTFAFFSKTPSYLKSLLEWRGWVVPSKLSYCVMLLHMMLVHVMTGARTQLSYYSSYDVIISYIYIVLASNLAAVPLHLLVEAPFITLFKNLLKRTSARGTARAGYNKTE